MNQKIDKLPQQINQASQPQHTQPSPIEYGRSQAAGHTPVTLPPKVTTAARAGEETTDPPTPTVVGPRPGRRSSKWTAGVCWTCGESGHRQAACPSGPPEEPRPPPQTRPIRGGKDETFKTSNVYLRGQIRNRAVYVLLDTGSDVSLAPYELIEKHKCRLRPSQTTALKAANGSDVIIAGEATLPLRVAGRLFHTVVLVSRDISETILGIDWLRQHEGEWDFVNERVRFGVDTEWIPLTGKNHVACRRIYAEHEVVLEPNRMQMIPARATLTNIRRKPSTTLVEPRQFQKGIYIGRTLLPPEHDKARVCMMNTTLQPVRIPAGTNLGHLQPAQQLDEAGHACRSRACRACRSRAGHNRSFTRGKTADQRNNRILCYPQAYGTLT
jgi:predicted aspartyl protease